jgi:hypothetical protein
MQIQLQAFGRKGSSLRKIISNDLRKKSYENLEVIEFKNPRRPRGWAKIKGKDEKGAINLEWAPNTRMLIARVITEKGNTPYKLLGTFLAYLTQRHGKRLASINIQLR